MERYYKFMGKDWANLLSSFLDSDEYKKNGKIIKEQIRNGLEITPDLNSIFNAFLECPLHKLHSIIIGQD